MCACVCVYVYALKYLSKYIYVYYNIHSYMITISTISDKKQIKEMLKIF